MAEISHQAFRDLIAHFEGPTFSSDPRDGINRDDWVSHFHACRACADAVLDFRMKLRGVEPTNYPCIHMAYRATETCYQHPDRAECHDLFIAHNEKFDEYALIKGQVSLTIGYCPWCGVDLPPSQRDRWFDELGALGIDPWSDDVPNRYKSAEWFKPVLKPSRS